MEIALTEMGFLSAAVFHPVICQDPQDLDAVCIKEGQNLVISEVCGHDLGPLYVNLGNADIAVGIDADLLLNAPQAFDRADIAGILGQKEGWMRALDLSGNLIFLFSFFQVFDLRFGQDVGVLRSPRLEQF